MKKRKYFMTIEITNEDSCLLNNNISKKQFDNLNYQCNKQLNEFLDNDIEYWKWQYAKQTEIEDCTTYTRAETKYKFGYCTITLSKDECKKGYCWND